MLGSRLNLDHFEYTVGLLIGCRPVYVEPPHHGARKKKSITAMAGF